MYSLLSTTYQHPQIWKLNDSSVLQLMTGSLHSTNFLGHQDSREKYLVKLREENQNEYICKSGKEWFDVFGPHGEME